MYLHFGYQQISPSGLINLETLKYNVSAVSGQFSTDEISSHFHENNFASTLVIYVFFYPLV